MGLYAEAQDDIVAMPQVPEEESFNIAMPSNHPCSLPDVIVGCSKSLDVIRRRLRFVEFLPNNKKDSWESTQERIEGNVGKKFGYLIILFDGLIGLGLLSPPLRQRYPPRVAVDADVLQQLVDGLWSTTGAERDALGSSRLAKRRNLLSQNSGCRKDFLFSDQDALDILLDCMETLEVSPLLLNPCSPYW